MRDAPAESSIRYLRSGNSVQLATSPGLLEVYQPAESSSIVPEKRFVSDDHSSYGV